MQELVKKYVELKNETLAYVEVGSGDKTIVLIHGNYSSSIHYYPFLTNCPKEYKIYAFDLRGFGDSSYNNSFNTIDELALDIIEAFETLNIKDINLVGWSLGGAVSLKIAAKRQDLVRKLVLIEGASHRGFPVFEKDEKYQNIYGHIYPSKEAMAKDPVLVVPALQGFKAQDRVFFDIIYMATMWNKKRPAEDEVAVYITETMKERCLVDTDWALANFNMSDASNLYNLGDGDIKDVKCPTLITLATEDLVVTEEMIMTNVNAIEGSTLKVYEHAGHSLITDIPELLLNDIVEFIK